VRRGKERVRRRSDGPILGGCACTLQGRRGRGRGRMIRQKVHAVRPVRPASSVTAEFVTWVVIYARP
jgi:hypothetical protein